MPGAAQHVRSDIDGDRHGTRRPKLARQCAGAGTGIHHPERRELNRDSPDEGTGELAVDIIETRLPQFGGSAIVGRHRHL
jgi:hypothetical protein